MMTKSLFVLTILAFLCAPLASANPSQTEVTEITGAVIKEQDVTFAVVVVKDTVLNDKNFADEMILVLEPTFGGIPVVLMMQDAEGTPSYYGRPDIVGFLAKVPFQSIPWKKYSLKESDSK